MALISNDMDEQAKKVLSRLEAQCSRREYCSGDVLSKAVKALDGNADQAAEILDSLIKDGFVLLGGRGVGQGESSYRVPHCS